MPKPKVFITRKIAQEAIDKISKTAEIDLWEDDLPPSRGDLLKRIRDIDGLLSLLTDKIDAEVMDSSPGLKVISNMAVGYDNIDIPAATQHGIAVGYTPGVLDKTTADFTFTLLLAAGRRLVEADRFTREGKWKTWGPAILLGHDIHHACLGIVGCGRIGLDVAKRAKGFDMSILYFDKVQKQPEDEMKFGLKFVPTLVELLRKADFITIHVPLTRETYHLIGNREFSYMKPTAVLINTSRGSVVDNKALYDALNLHQIFGAALDVTEVEPIPPNDPLLTLNNLIIAPHIASASVATRNQMALMAANNLLAGLSGKDIPNLVNSDFVNYRKRKI
jgi:glyoxylate reductase